MDRPVLDEEGKAYSLVKDVINETSPNVIGVTQRVRFYPLRTVTRR